MPKKPNYNFEKRQREAAKRQKREEKLQKKREQASPDGSVPSEPGDGAAPSPTARERAPDGASSGGG